MISKYNSPFCSESKLGCEITEFRKSAGIASGFGFI